MSMTPETPNDPLYMSAPTSPRRIKEGLCFLSNPTSPTRRSTLKAWDAANSSNSDAADEFEFETSRRFNVADDEYKVISEQKPHQNGHVRRESLPAMAFADELFADGKVMPLKPPPRLQYPDEKKFGTQISSTLSSPRSPNGVLRLRFHRSRSLWNDDFDPFMVALKNVKDETKKVHRRSRSMSPFRETTRPNGSQSKLKMPSFPMWDSDQVKPVVKKRSITLAEPKGVFFARQARLVRPTSITPAPTVEAGESAKEGRINCSKETKSQKIINFVFRSGSGSMRKYEYKPKTKSSNGKDSRLTKKFSFKSTGLTQCNEGKRVSEMNRITLLQYRPKLLVCMGYGSK